MLLLLSLLAQPAVAAGGRSLTLTVVDAAGTPIPTAAVVPDLDDTRHPVNSVDGTWQTSAFYPPQAAEVVLQRGTLVQGWVVAPGYVPTRFEVQANRRKAHKTVTLATMDTRPGSVPLPSEEHAAAVRQNLREAAAALQMKDLTTAGARLDLADRRRIVLEGRPYVDSTLAVMELRTLVAMSAWQRRLEKFTEAPDEAHKHALDVSRGVTADLALDWKDYARGAGRSEARATALCRTASGRVSRCD